MAGFLVELVDQVGLLAGVLSVTLSEPDSVVMTTVRFFGITEEEEGFDAILVVCRRDTSIFPGNFCCCLSILDLLAYAYWSGMLIPSSGSHPPR